MKKRKLEDLIELTSGSPQFRITESTEDNAPIYSFYGQQEIENDLAGIEVNTENAKSICTFDDVNILNEGEVVFSLISGRTALVRSAHQGYLYTQNYVKLVPKEEIDIKYLIYILNESEHIKKQWLMGLQGSAVLKHTVKQLRELELPKLHDLDKQQTIGNIYFCQLRLQALKNRAANTERIITFEKLKEVK
ncbi:MAG: restriction endonuclease subunit S [Lachnospiraceae bacterium]|nr:restriction endonuclease subunit S [Lachnospiraceae bacterium]